MEAPILAGPGMFGPPDAGSPPLRAGLLLAGLAWGSFLNVLIHRLPRGESVVRPASRCPSCGVPIRARDNFPVLSFVLLRGRCRSCRERISSRYPLVELLTGAIFASAPLHGWAPAAAWVLFLSLLLALAATDWERMVLPDALTVSLAALGLLLAGPRGDLQLATAALGAGVGAGLLWFLRWVWLRFRKMEALGRGDIKMMLGIGAFLGPVPTLHALALASALGLVPAAVLLALRRIGRNTPLPFGTLLSVGAAAVFVLTGR